MGLAERFKRNTDEDGLNSDKVAEMMGERGSPMRIGLQQPRRVMWQLMAGGVLDRHPGLKVALTEIRADWVPATLDHLTTRFAEKQVPGKLTPREYWERHFLVVPSSIHRAEVAMRHEIGVGQLGFGQDYPHWEGVWPDTLAWLQDAFGERPRRRGSAPSSAPTPPRSTASPSTASTEVAERIVPRGRRRPRRARGRRRPRPLLPPALRLPAPRRPRLPRRDRHRARPRPQRAVGHGVARPCHGASRSRHVDPSAHRRSMRRW